MPKTIYLVMIIASLSSCKAPLSLTLNLPENERFQYEITNRSNTSSHMMGMDIEVGTDQVMDMAMTAVGKTPAGDTRVEVVYTDIRSNVITPQGNDSYDSKSDEQQFSTQTPVYEAMLNHPFTITYSSNGKIVEVAGMEEMFENMFASFPPEMRANMEQLVGGGMMTEMLNNMTLFYPPGPVKIGDSWQVDNAFEIGGMSMKVETIYSLSKRENGQAFLDVTGVVFTDPDSDGMELNGMTLQYDLEGTQTGTLVIDEAIGWMQAMEMFTEMGGVMNMMNIEDFGDMEIRMQVTTENLMQRME